MCCYLYMYLQKKHGNWLLIPGIYTIESSWYPYCITCFSLWKAYQKIHKFVDVIAYFSVQQWKFTNQNVQALQSRMAPLDQELFDFNVARLDWQSVFRACMEGLRVHFAKEPLDNLPVARKRYRRCSQEVFNNLLIISSSLVVHRWYSSCLLVLVPDKSGLCVVLMLLRSLSDLLR